MKMLVAFSVFLAFFSQALTKTARINQYVTDAQAAYNRKDFTTAIYLYQFLNDSMRVRDRELKINLAHAYFQRKNTQQALQQYQPLLTKTSPRISSLINLQLGVVVASQNKTQALAYFKKALVLNPLNEEARYNYELVKKYLVRHPEESSQALPPSRPEQAKTEKTNPKAEKESGGIKENPQGVSQAEIPDFNQADPQNAPLPNGSETNPGSSETPPNTKEELAAKTTANRHRQEHIGTLPGTTRGVANSTANNKNRHQGKGGHDESDDQDGNSQTIYQRLQEADITPEKARMLLDAMREAEIQYLQQIPRKQTSKSNSDKPNW